LLLLLLFLRLPFPAQVTGILKQHQEWIGQQKFFSARLPTKRTQVECPASRYGIFGCPVCSGVAFLRVHLPRPLSQSVVRPAYNNTGLSYYLYKQNTDMNKLIIAAVPVRNKGGSDNFKDALLLNSDLGSSVSIVSGYGLDNREIEVRSPAEASVSRPALGPTQPPIQ
jgi:hypothetical protein